MKYLMMLIIVSSLALSSGCAFYNKKVAPHIPNIKLGLGAEVSGRHVGVSLNSSWDEEKGERERSIGISK